MPLHSNIGVKPVGQTDCRLKLNKASAKRMPIMCVHVGPCGSAGKIKGSSSLPTKESYWLMGSVQREIVSWPSSKLGGDLFGFLFRVGLAGQFGDVSVSFCGETCRRADVGVEDCGGIKTGCHFYWVG